MKSGILGIISILSISRIVYHGDIVSGADNFKRGVGDLEEKLILSVQEGLPAGTVIGKIQKKPGYSYKLNEQNPYFAFDAQTGEVRTLTELDRESLSLDKDRIDLLIVANSPTYFITVSINVEDVNDNFPTFPFPYRNITVPENAPIGSLIPLSGARDSDRGDNGTISSYRLNNDNADTTFRLITTNSSINDGLGLSLELIKPLDRETRSLYVFNISASDKGQPVKTGFTTLYVNVLDSNDNAPVFDRAQYYVTCNENAPRGLVLLSVSATDKDINDNGRVTYKLNNGDTANQFLIDSQTGQLSVAKTPLSCPLQNCGTSNSNCSKICILTVEARDFGAPSQTGRSYINVKLADENNHSPEITFRYLSPGGGGGDYVSVEETKPIGTIIAVVTATDADSDGDNGRVAVSIATGDPLGHFRLDTNDDLMFGTIRTNSRLNKLKFPAYNLTVLAHDFGKPPRYSSKILRIFVAKGVDLAPNFDQRQYATNLLENSPPGSRVAAVRAVTDKTDKKIVYSIAAGNDLSIFRIDNVTGLITTSGDGVIDYEIVQNFTLTIRAKFDQQPTVNSSEVKVYVSVIDLNDNAPVFENSIYNLSISDNATLRQALITLAAKDNDSGINGRVGYRFADNDKNISTDGIFGLQTETGQLYLAQNLHTLISQERFYRLSIKAYDFGTPSLDAQVQVLITVQNSNYHSPYFYPTEYYVNLRKDSQPGSHVTTVKALDQDEGRFGELDFYIRQAPIGAFDLEPKTGRISLKRLPFGRQRVDLILGAKDGGGLMSDNNATVHVFVEDNADNRPKFVKSFYEFQVDEDNGLTGTKVGQQNNGRVIGSVSVTDKDDKIQYQIINGDPGEIFSIGQYSGEIRSAKFLDYELRPRYQLTVVAIPTAGGISVTTVSVSLNDLNDNVPMFVNNKHDKQVYMTLDKNHPVGLPFNYAFAYDPDNGLNGTVRYGINPNSTDFQIDNTFGTVFLNKPAFLLTNEKYNLTITAHDLGVPKNLHNTIHLIVTLSGQYDSTRSLFSTPFLQYNVLESTPVNSVLFSLNVTYLSNETTIFYESVESRSTDIIGVFPDGKIYVKNELDYEMVSFITLTVRGTVQDIKTRSALYSSTATIYFQILDENDNEPVCVNETYTFFLPESSDPLTYVGNVEARDADNGLNAFVSYRFRDNVDYGNFRIDSSTGAISSVKVFDRESMMETSGSHVIKLKVEAYDHGSPASLSTVCPVDIVITDINDNPPQFQLDFYTARIFEDSEINTQVLQFNAVDVDEDAQNSNLHYRLIEGNQNRTFWLNETSGQLFLRKSLDRETTDNYYLTIFVSDSGNPPLNNSAYATIVILDVNDNAPKFLPTLQTDYRLSETTEIGTIISALSAEDPDEGLSGSVKYYLQSGNLDRTFEIDEISGELKLIKSLDYESIRNYTLSIAAADQSTPGLSSRIQIQIQVDDENDNAPTVNSSTLLGKVFRNAPIGTLVTVVTVTDSDSDANGRLTFSLLNQVPTNGFAIDSATGAITVNSNNVGDKIQNYKLLIEVSDTPDNKSQKVSTQRFVDIIVTDYPTSDDLISYIGPKAIVVDSSIKPDFRILSLKSSYQITKSDDDLFTLSTDGGLYLKRQANLNKPYYKVYLDKKDKLQNGPKLSVRSVQPVAGNNTLDLIVLINYGKSGVIKFDNDEYVFEAPEDIAVGAEIGKVKATGGRKVEYYVTKVQSSNLHNLPVLVDVDAYSGSLRIDHPLLVDRADDDLGGIAQFSVQLYAIDAEGSYGSSSCTVTVKILKSKDAPPKFTENLYEFRTSEDAPVGTVIGIVALSNNGSSDSTMEFSIDNRSIDSNSMIFNVNPRTGVITNRYLLDRDTKSVHTLLATVGGGVYSRGAFIRIILDDVNDNAPTFLKENYYFRVHENSERNSFVGVVKARDPDFGLNGTVEYEFEYAESVSEFHIDSSTGIVTVNGIIDAEKKPFYIISIIAKDKGVPSKRTKVKLYIEILDLNDNQPYLVENSFELKIYENITVESQLMQLSPIDLDSETSFSYVIESGDPWRQFRLDGNGSLFVAKTLDRETRSVHRLRVTVYDAPPTVALRHSCTAEIAVTLLDVNDNAPRVVSSSSVLVFENSPNGTLVTQLVAQDPDEGQNAVTYFRLNPKNFAVPPFAVDPVTGRVTVNGPLDRESIDNYRLSIFAYDRESPELRTDFPLTVWILDLDDNRPKFLERFLQLPISEDLAIGQSLIQLGVTDKDSPGENTAAKFRIADGDVNQDFTIGPYTGLLYLAHPLNYERSSAYNLTVALSGITDAAADNVDDKATVIVNVIDVNDNAPTFSRTPIIASVAENFFYGSSPITIGKASAFDPDSGLNGKLSYSITQGNTSAFSIDSLNGDIKLNGPLDREIQDVYKLTVQASDSGAPRLSGFAEIVINVLDLNDNAPRFETSEYFVEGFTENQPSGTFVTRVLAHDQDIEQNGIVEYSIKIGEEDDFDLPFSIDKQSGVIVTRFALDREFKSLWNFTVIASDRGRGAPLKSSALVLVKVGDQNDNLPIVRNARQDVFLKSPSSKGEFVYAVDAYDLDDGANGRLKFSLTGKDGDYFEIDTQSGVILSKYASAPQDSYAIDVTVADGGSPTALQASISYRLFFSVALTNFPSFFVAPSNGTTGLASNGGTSATLKENVAVGTVVGTVSARSSKSAPTNKIVYGILAGNSNAATFDIDPDSGRLTVGFSGLDYERVQHYELWISASDSDNPPLTSFLRFSIRVTDVNDNAPRFAKPAYTLRVLEEEPPPVVLADLSASDADSGDNGRIEYSLIVPPPFEDYFEIDKTNGRLSTMVQIDREKRGKFEFLAVAKDRGEPALSGTSRVTVVVDDINDNAPKFSRLFSASIREDAEPGQFVTLVTSSDADSVENSNNTYYLAVNPNKRFAIDPYSGNVTVAANLDREYESEYQLKVVAVDGAWRVETSLLITVLDANDNAPIFVQSIYMFNISEMQPENTFIGRVNATDLDASGPNSKIRYKMKEKSKFFSINAVSGQINSSSMLQYKKTGFNENIHRLTVIGQDNGRPSLSSSAVVVIKVLEVNRGFPVFDRAVYKFAVPKSTKASLTVGRVRAIDKIDTGPNAQISYRLLQLTDFFVDQNTGIIRSVDILNNEVGREYRTTVIATDQGNPSKSSSSDLLIAVVGPNLHKPKFTSASYGATLTEDAPPNSFVLKLEARDADDGLNGEIRYQLDESLASSRLFALNESTGVLTLSGSLDYESESEYNLKVWAFDGGYEIQNGSSTVNINVKNVNDNWPTFKFAYFECYVKENVDQGTRVCRINAQDADGPPFDKIFYSFCSSDDDKDIDRTFLINTDTGEVYTNGGIDYESRSTYHYTVCASDDRNYPELSENDAFTAKARLTIFAQSVNEFLPKFDRSNYRINIPANASIESHWQVAKALDNDQGIDGVVYYFIDNSFDLSSDSLSQETLSGSLIVDKKLPTYAVVTNKTLTYSVGVKNRGSVDKDTLDFAQITVQITLPESYIAPPIFARSVYTVAVAENSLPGTSLLPVSVSGDHQQILYKILNDSSAFSIDSKTGLLKVKGQIDRETMDRYNVTVLAYYNNDPALFGSCTVLVTVTDVNDNGPYLPRFRSYGRILEGSPIGTNITAISPEDPDVYPNTYPYNMSLVYNSRESSLFELDGNTGVLKSKAIFDRELRDRYDLNVLITDNGQPRQSSTVKFTIIVDDINDNPSSSELLDVVVYIYNSSHFVGMPIGSVFPNDVDTVGDYQCHISYQSMLNVKFSLDSGCLLLITIDKPSDVLGVTYFLSMKGTDGFHDWVDYNITVKLQSISSGTIDKAAIMDIISVNEYPVATIVEDLSKYVSKRGHFMQIVSYTKENSKIRLAAVLTDRGGEEMSAELTAKLLSSIQYDDNQTMVNFYIQRADYGRCFSSPCKNGGKCIDQVLIENQDTERSSIQVSRKLYSYASDIRRQFHCQCADGFIGKHCDITVDQCVTLGCQNGATCRQFGGKAYCQCPSGFQGELCQADVNECTGADHLCHNGGYCENTNGSYKCICMVGFSGPNCLHSSDTCASEPCFNEGVCEKTSTNDYRCLCKFGFSGRNCEISSLGFDQLSFVELKPLSTSEDNFQFSLEFATVQGNCLLVHLAEKSNNSNWLVFDIVEGSLRFRLTTAGSKIVFDLKLPQKVNDGKWYLATFALSSKMASVSVGSCSSVDNACDLCSNNEARCSVKKDINLSGFWSIVSASNLIIGSLKTSDDIQNLKRDQLSSVNFVGCVRNILINNRSIDEHGVIDKSKIIDQCPRSNESPCSAKNSCRDGETCLDAWSKRECRCKGGYSATNCEEAEIGSAFGGRSFVTYKLSEAYRRKLLAKSILSISDKSPSDRYRRSTGSRRAEHWLSFEFRTTLRDGLLFFAASGENFSLIDISNDTIRYMSKTSDSSPIQVILNRDLTPSDGEWHTVFLNLFDDARTVELNVDDRGKETSTPDPVHVFLSPFLTALSVGGTLVPVKVFGIEIPKFNGCFRRFIVDGMLQPLGFGETEIFDATSNGEITIGCAGASLRCVSPPCTAAPLPQATVNAGIAAVVVFFVCLVASIVIAYLIVRRIRRRKALNNAAPTPEPDPNLNTNIKSTESAFGFGFARDSTGNLKAGSSSKDSGIVVGDSREVLDRCSSDLSTTGERHRQVAPFYNVANVQPRIPANPNINARFWDDSTRPIYSTPECYDLDNASSIAPSDTDVAYHYKGYRGDAATQQKRPLSSHSSKHSLRNSVVTATVTSTPLRNNSPSLLPPITPSSAKGHHQRSSRRSTPVGGAATVASVSTSSEEEDIRRSRRAPSTKSSRSKRRTASSPRRKNTSSLKRKQKPSDPPEGATTPLSSVQRGDYRFRGSNPGIMSDEDDGDYPDDDDSPPALPPRTYVKVKSAVAMTTKRESESDYDHPVVNCDLDLDTVRKPRHLIRPDSSAADETETESDLNCVYGSRDQAVGHVTLAAFRVGPRSMFPVSEDESDFSAKTRSTRPPVQHNPNLEAYV